MRRGPRGSSTRPPEADERRQRRFHLGGAQAGECAEPALGPSARAEERQGAAQAYIWLTRAQAIELADRHGSVRRSRLNDGPMTRPPPIVAGGLSIRSTNG